MAKLKCTKSVASKELSMKRKNVDVDGYSCIEDVYSEIRGVYMEDLIKHTVGLDQKVLDSLVDDPRGVYIDGVFEPLINLDTCSCFTLKKDRQLMTFEEIIREPKIIVGNKVYNIQSVRRLLREKPKYSYSACYFLLSRIYETLSQLCRDTRVSTNVSQKKLHYETWVKDSDVVLPSSSRVVSSVLDFIGNDVFSYYSLELRNTTVVIHKHNDFRVVEYYKRIFGEMDEDLELRFLEKGY